MKKHSVYVIEYEDTVLGVVDQTATVVAGDPATALRLFSVRYPKATVLSVVRHSEAECVEGM